MKKLLSLLIIIIIITSTFAIVYADSTPIEWFKPRWEQNERIWFSEATVNSMRVYSEVYEKTYFCSPQRHILQTDGGTFIQGSGYTLENGIFKYVSFGSSPGLRLSYRFDATPEELGLVTYSAPLQFLYKRFSFIKDIFSGLLTNLRMVLGLDGSIEYDGTTGDIKVSISTGVNVGTESEPVYEYNEPVKEIGYQIIDNTINDSSNNTYSIYQYDFNTKQPIETYVIEKVPLTNNEYVIDLGDQIFIRNIINNQSGHIQIKTEQTETSARSYGQTGGRSMFIGETEVEVADNGSIDIIRPDNNVEYYTKPDIKINNTRSGDYYILLNDVSIYHIFEVGQFTIDGDELDYIIGENNIKIIDIDEYVADEINIIFSEVEEILPVPIEDDTTGGYLTWIGNILNKIQNIIMMPFKLLGNLITSMFESVVETINSFSSVTNMAGLIFGFLPTEVIGAITALLLIIIVFTAIKIIRG